MGNGVHNVKGQSKEILGRREITGQEIREELGVFDISNLEEETKMQTIKDQEQVIPACARDEVSWHSLTFFLSCLKARKR